MTVRKFINDLINLREDLKDKDISIVAQNGLLLTPKIKFLKKEKYSLDLSSKNVESVVIHHE